MQEQNQETMTVHPETPVAPQQPVEQQVHEEKDKVNPAADKVVTLFQKVDYASRLYSQKEKNIKSYTDHKQGALWALAESAYMLDSFAQTMQDMPDLPSASKKAAVVMARTFREQLLK